VGTLRFKKTYFNLLGCFSRISNFFGGYTFLLRGFSFLIAGAATVGLTYLLSNNSFLPIVELRGNFQPLLWLPYPVLIFSGQPALSGCATCMTMTQAPWVLGLISFWHEAAKKVSLDLLYIVWLLALKSRPSGCSTRVLGIGVYFLILGRESTLGKNDSIILQFLQAYLLAFFWFGCHVENPFGPYFLDGFPTRSSGTTCHFQIYFWSSKWGLLAFYYWCNVSPMDLLGLKKSKETLQKLGKSKPGPFIFAFLLGLWPFWGMGSTDE